MLNFGDIGLDMPFFQAALSGYSDHAMRRLARQFGAPLTFAGVMLARSAAHPKVMRLPAFRPGNDEYPLGAQILGTEPDVMAAAAKSLQAAGYDLIDLNIACPAPKVLRRGRGGALLRDPDRVIEIFRRVREAVDCPILMKLRAGYNKSQEDMASFWEIVSRAAAEGVDGLVIHGRSVSERFRGEADWAILAEAKRRFPQTTIVGSGDMFEPDDIVECVRTSGVDGALIARGAVGNPWIFRDLRALFAGEPRPSPPGLDEQRQVILEHLEWICELLPARRAVGYFRKFIVGYCKRHPQRRDAQAEILAANNRDEMVAAIRRWF